MVEGMNVSSKLPPTDRVSVSSTPAKAHSTSSFHTFVYLSASAKVNALLSFVL